MKWMRQYAVGLALAGTLLGTACASKHIQPATPKAGALIKANDVDVRVLELVKAIDEACGPAPACRPNSLDTALAKTLVQACMDVSAVARKAADGWVAAAKAIWAQAKPKFSTVTNPAIVAAFGLVDGLLGGA